ncbi:LysR family transcriptional regulator [Sedimentitalea nanhaiensis]|uniref:Transcriptional regulator, LysR family n=1 Tax=Sedimentitalea nanhaiensis TaxID=999627 RepID=A0A1I7EAL6_9RHOB|nr:LysR family transcriptional regulator [Sedimentitalea nanhaiensis]SFU20903.1 transcriptional regulator, LysR family [Sedimentitalea nanhaiensis]
MHALFLKYFDEVARHRSIRKAAAVLNVSSTSVNRQILGVERALGVALFDRTSAGVELTTIGSILLEHCRKTLHDFERTKVLIDDLRDLRTGHINIETIDSVAYGILPQALQKFGQTFPDISISVTTAQPDEVMRSVANGDADVGITFMIDMHPNVRVISEKPAPFGVILRPDHPLAERDNVIIEDVCSYRLIRTIDARGRNSIIDQVVSTLAAPLSTHMFTNTLFLAKQMILENQGIGLYTKIGFLKEIDQNQLKFVPLIQEGLNDMRIGMLVSATQGIGPAKRHLCDVVSRAIRELRLDA